MCFLYRVFEYAAANHYKPMFNPTQYKPEDAIEYYLNLALTYNPNPLYYMDFGSEKAKPKLYNFFYDFKVGSQKNIWMNGLMLRFYPIKGQAKSYI